MQNNSKIKQKPYRRTSQFQPLEPRLLFDAALPVVTEEAVMSNTETDSTSSSQQDGADNSLNLLVESEQYDLSAYNQVLFIDNSVQDFEQLLDNLSRDIHVVIIESSESGITAVNNTLSQMGELEAIHIITHGQAGQFNLGTDLINADLLNSTPDLFTLWNDKLVDDGDVLLYGCNVAEGALGSQFVDLLGELLNADIAASEDITGHSNLSGNWDLEYNFGDVETPVAFNAETQSKYHAKLNNQADLFISSWVNLGNNNQALEIVNTTGSSVDLSNYQIVIYADGSASVTTTISLSGNLDHNSLFVLSNSAADNALITDNDTASNANLSFDGNDVIVLQQTNSTVADSLGEIGSNSVFASAGVYNKLVTNIQRDTDASNSFNISNNYVTGNTSDPGLGRYESNSLPTTSTADEDSGNRVISLNTYFENRLNGSISYSIEGGNKLSASESNGVLTITAPQYFGGTEDFTITATGNDNVTSEITISVTYTPVANTPSIVTVNTTVTGTEDDGAIALGGITTSLIDTDSSEEPSNVIITLPSADWSINGGAKLSDTQYQFLTTQISSLSVTPPAGYGDVSGQAQAQVTIQFTATEKENSDSATATAQITIAVDQVAATPTITSNDTNVNEFVEPVGQKFNPNLVATPGDSDGSETIQDVIIRNIPTNLTITNGNNEPLTPDNGTLTLNQNPNSGAVIDITQIQFEATNPNNFQITVQATSVNNDFDNNSTNFSNIVTIHYTPTESVDPPILNFGIDGTIGSTGDNAQAGADNLSGSTTTVVDTNADVISLPITAEPSELNSNETLTVTVSNIPVGVTISQGGTSFTATNGNQSTSFSGSGEINGFAATLLPTSRADFTLNVEVSSDNPSSPGNTSGTLHVNIIPPKPTISLGTSTVQVNEDGSINLGQFSITASTTDPSDTVNSTTDSLTYSITGLPSGVSFSNTGSAIVGSTSITNISQGDLDAITITMPAYDHLDFSFSVNATQTEPTNNDTNSRSTTATVQIQAVSNAPTFSSVPVTVVNIDEDQDDVIGDGNVNLQKIVTSLVDTDGSETLKNVVATNVPDEVTFNLGSKVGANSWSFLPDTLKNNDLIMTIAENYSVNGNVITFTATSQDIEGAAAASTQQTITINITPVADQATLTTPGVSGDEDTAIVLNVSSALADTDGSESWELVITGIPTDASLSNDSGAITVSSGSATLTDPSQLAGLSITPPSNSDADFTLTYTVTTTETSNSATETISTTQAVDVDAVADKPNFNVANVDGGLEDSGTPIPIGSAITGIALADMDGSEVLDSDTPDRKAVQIFQIPEGSVLASPTLGSVTVDSSGSVDMKVADLTGLTITPPTHVGDDFTIRVRVTATETSNEDTAQRTKNMTISLTPVADTPTLSITNTASGTEDQLIGLNIGGSLVDQDGSETLTFEISGLLEGAKLLDSSNNTLFTATSGDTSFVADATQISGIKYQAPLNYHGLEVISVKAIATEENSSGANKTAESAAENITITIAADADAPTITAGNVTTTEAQVESNKITLDLTSIALTDTDNSETLSDLTISNVPNDFIVRVDNVIRAQSNNSFTLSETEVANSTVTLEHSSNVHYSGLFELTLSATTTEGSNNDQETTQETVTIRVNAIADAPSYSSTPGFLNQVYTEGSMNIPFSINGSASVDTDGSEVLTAVVKDVPTGASFNKGTNNNDGSWSFANNELTGITFTPPTQNGSNITMTIDLTSTDTNPDDNNNVHTAVVSQTVTLQMSAVVDTPTLTVNNVSGPEDTQVSLSISATTADTDGSETLSYVITVPAGTSLSAGTDNGDNTWTLTAAEIGTVKFIPPKDVADTFDLSVTVTSSEGGQNATDTESFTVTTTAVADDPNLSTQNANGNEDTDIPLSITTSLVDTDNSESLTVTISNIPTGASLTNTSGDTLTINNGSITLQPGQLAGLKIKPPTHDADNFTLTVTSTATDGSSTAVTTSNINVSVTPVADAPSLSATSPASGPEDTAIDLTISSSLVDTDDSETGPIIVISGVPSGAELNKGTDNGDGSWTLTTAQLSGLQITHAENVAQDFTLTVTSTTTETGNNNKASASVDIDVSFTQDADIPNLTVSNVTTIEDNSVALGISSSLVDTDNSESLSLDISGFPTGSSLTNTAGDTLTINNGATTLTPAQLTGLSVTPPSHYSGVFTLTVVATSTDGSDTATNTKTMDVTVNVDADAPSFSGNGPEFQSATVAEDTQNIPLTINASASADQDNSEGLSMVISNVPTNASFNKGTNNGDGTWRFDNTQLTGITFTPPAHFSGNIELTVTLTSTDTNPSNSNNVDTASVSDTVSLTVTPVTDTPTLVLNNVSGIEDNTIPLSISGSTPDTDGSETLSYTLTLPTGMSLTKGTNNNDGTWTVSSTDISTVAINPGQHVSGSFTIQVSLTSTENNVSVVDSGSFTLSVTPDADTPTLTVVQSSGNEDSAIPLNITSNLVDLDSSESLSIKVSGIPEGATFSAGTDNGDGSYTLTKAQLTGLSITPPTHDSSNFTLTVTSTATDGSDTASNTATIDVTINPVADAPNLSVTSPASGPEDTDVALNISSSLVDNSVNPESGPVIIISGIPDGASLNNGTDNGDGSYTLTVAQLSGLEITDTTHLARSFSLTVTSTSTETQNSDTASSTANITVSFTQVADTPNLTVSNASGNEDTAIPLAISPSLVDTDGSESLSIVVSNIPADATLTNTAGDTLTISNGQITLTAAQLTGLSITPSTDNADNFTLTVTATATDGSSTASRIDNIAVTVNPVADAPTLSVTTPVNGIEDQPTALNISSTLVDQDDSESLKIKITGVPSDAILSNGTKNNDGSWTLESADLSGLTISLPQDKAQAFILTVTSSATESGNGSQASTSATIQVNIAAVADTPTLSASGATGSEDTAIPVSISISENDNDGSEDLSVLISGFTQDAVLSNTNGDALNINSNGEITLTQNQLNGLTVARATHVADDMTLTVKGISTDGSSTAETSQSITIDFVPKADQPNLTTPSSVQALEDNTIGLNISSSLVDTDNSETIDISISGLPEGFSLNNGTQGNNNTYSLTQSDLSGLSIQVLGDSDEDFNLTVTSTATDSNGDTASISKVIPVTITAVADTPSVSTSAVTVEATGTVDVPVTVGNNDNDGSENLSVVLSNLPANELSLSHPTLSLPPIIDGSVTLTPAQLANLIIVPNVSAQGTFNIGVEVTALDNDNSTAIATDNFSLVITPVSSETAQPQAPIIETSPTEPTIEPTPISPASAILSFPAPAGTSTAAAIASSGPATLAVEPSLAFTEIATEEATPQEVAQDLAAPMSFIDLPGLNDLNDFLSNEPQTFGESTSFDPLENQQIESRFTEGLFTNVNTNQNAESTEAESNEPDETPIEPVAMNQGIDMDQIFSLRQGKVLNEANIWTDEVLTQNDNINQMQAKIMRLFV